MSDSNRKMDKDAYRDAYGYRARHSTKRENYEKNWDAHERVLTAGRKFEARKPRDGNDEKEGQKAQHWKCINSFFLYLRS